MPDDPSSRAPQPSTALGVPDVKILELLVCPLTKTSLLYDKQASELVSRKARLAFPVRSGVAILVAAEARELGDDEIPGGSHRS